jgi:threonine/homoserine/homoserine lactone efflux protein
MVVSFLLVAGFLFFFWLGYNFGRRAERWEQNHPKKKEEKELPKDRVKEFLDNLNKN